VLREHEELLRAAKALLDNDFKAPQDIIPTVVFAVVSTGNRHLEELKESLAANALSSEYGRVFRQRFAQAFEFHSIYTLIDGVPIISQNLVHIRGTYKDDSLKEIERIAIGICDLSVTAKQVYDHYENALESFGVDNSSPQKGEEGMIGWQVDPGVIDMVIYPTLADPPTRADLARSLRQRARRNRPSFPPPAMVAQTYDMLRGSKKRGKFQGFGRVMLPGNLTNQPEAKTLLPACVAWYLAGRKKPDDSQTKKTIAELLNQRLLGPCGLESLMPEGSDFNQLWGNVGKHAETLNDVERAFIASSKRYGLIADFHSGSGK
jgi:hypothetical protein